MIFVVEGTFAAEDIDDALQRLARHFRLTVEDLENDGPPPDEHAFEGEYDIEVVPLMGKGDRLRSRVADPLQDPDAGGDRHDEG